MLTAPSKMQNGFQKWLRAVVKSLGLGTEVAQLLTQNDLPLWAQTVSALDCDQ